MLPFALSVHHTSRIVRVTFDGALETTPDCYVWIVLTAAANDYDDAVRHVADRANFATACDTDTESVILAMTRAGWDWNTYPVHEDACVHFIRRVFTRIAQLRSVKEAD